jgi:hypothetical protein
MIGYRTTGGVAGRPLIPAWHFVGCNGNRIWFQNVAPSDAVPIKPSVKQAGSTEIICHETIHLG